MRSSLDNIIKLEHDEMWKEKNKPQINEELYLSQIHMDILMVLNKDFINEHADTSSTCNVSLLPIGGNRVFIYIYKSGKPFIDCEVVKECLLEVAEELCQKSQNNLKM